MVEASQRIRALVRSSPATVAINAPRALPMTLRDSLTVSLSVDIMEVNLNSWQIGKLLADHSLQQSAVLYLYGDTANAHSAVAGSSRERKRKAALEPRSQMEPQAHEDTHGPSTTGKRKPRKCRNCQSTQRVSVQGGGLQKNAHYLSFRYVLRIVFPFYV